MLILEKKYELSEKDRESTELCRHWWFKDATQNMTRVASSRKKRGGP
eukprot:COSAG05_NODE_18929_length_300_cov_1.273632_1_plen_46_part_10